jgi:hypothetical protein
MSDEFKSYAVLPKGSYWIFEEVSTKEIDSVYLYKADVQMKNGESKLGYNYERIVAGFYCSRVDDSIRHFSYPERGDQKFYQLVEIWLSDFINASTIFFDPSEIGAELHYAEDFRTTYAAHFNELTIGGRVYNDVRVYSHNVQYYPNQSKKIYFAKNVGIVKRELYNGEVWEVVRYNIAN